MSYDSAKFGTPLYGVDGLRAYEDFIHQSGLRPGDITRGEFLELLAMDDPSMFSAIPMLI